MKKICTKCKNEKDLIEFSIKRASKDGYGNRCKFCIKEYNDNYDFKKYNIDNKDKISIRALKYYQNNKEYIKNNSKTYFNKNINTHRTRVKKWYDNNKEYHQTKTKIYIKKRLKEDPIFKLKETLRKRLHDLLIKNKTPKVYSSFILLGCSVSECKQHLESQFKPEMNWDNHGKVWEIDHIQPCSKFNLELIEEQQKCFHYTNLQPLFKTTKIAESFGYNEIGNRNKYNKS
jgi:hypothetical protein